MKLIVLGGTGLVGRYVLELALADTRISVVIAPTRRPIPARPGLLAPLVDFEQLPGDAPWWHADAMICALGTTMKKAGSRETFRRIDHEYPLAAAHLALRHGVGRFVLNSAMGANPDSRFFYNRVKGELESDLRALGFASLTFVRPGLISGQRDEFRLGERTAELFLRATAPVLPRRWKINPAPNIARAMLDAAVAGRPGASIVGSAQMV